ncbi:MAG TPA: hypothetical protein VL198_05960 [Pseudolabrys sp.]|nr:hypothetical protein [Pseudolabrys sp.]
MKRPFGWRVAQGRNADATGQPSFDGGLDQSPSAIEIVMLTWRRLHFWRAAILLSASGILLQRWTKRPLNL